MAKKRHRILKIAFKTLLVLISTVVFLLLLITTLLIIPPTGNYIKQKVVAKAEKELDTDISIGSIRYTPPAQIAVRNFYIQGTDKDTLAYGDYLSVSVKLLPLLKKHLVIENAKLQNSGLRLIRDEKDSLFNFAFNTATGSETDSSTTKPMKISVGTVVLDHIHFLMDDAVSKNKMQVNLGHFKVDMDEIDLQQNAFTIKDFELTNTTAFLHAGISGSETDESSGPMSLIVNLRRKGVLKNCAFKYEDASGSVIDAQKINLETKDNTFDLGRQIIALKSLELANSILLIYSGSPGDSVIVEGSEPDSQYIFSFPDWNITVDELNFENNVFSLDPNQDITTSGFDPKHIHISDFTGSLENFKLDKKGIKGNLNKLSLHSDKRFQIKNLTAGLSVQETSLKIDPLEISTPASSYSGKLALSYNSLQELLDQPQSIKIESFNQNAGINLNDVAYFIPELSDSFPKLTEGNTVLNLHTVVKGNPGALDISQFDLFVKDKADLKLKGLVKGLPDADKIETDIDIKKLWMNYPALKSYLAGMELPENLVLPDTILISGKAKGTLLDLKADLSVKSVQGEFLAKASYKGDTLQNTATVDVILDIPGYRLGELLNNPDTIGALSANADLHTVFSQDEVKQLNGQVRINSLAYSGHSYRDITINAEQKNDTILAVLNSDDPELRLSSNASYFAKDSMNSIKVVLNVDYVDLQALKLYDEDMRLGGQLSADMSGKLPDDFTGSLSVNKLIVNRNNTVYYPDSLLLNAQVGDTNHIVLISPFAAAEYNGTLNPLDLPGLFKNVVTFLSASGDTSTIQKTYAKTFNFKLTLKEDPVYTQLLVPDLKQLNPSSFIASYNQEDGLDAKLLMPYMEYGSVAVDSFYLSLSADDDNFDYRTGFREIHSEAVTLPTTRLSGSRKGMQLFNTFDLPWDKKGSNYYIQAVISKPEKDDGMRLSILSDSLILNRNAWGIRPDNAILFSNNRIDFRNFNLTHGSDTLEIASYADESRESTNIHFANFNLKTLASLAKYDGTAPSALINGDATFGRKDDKNTFTSDLLISDLTLFGNTVFSLLDLKAEQKSENLYSFKIDLQNNGLTSTLKGQYNVGEQTNLDMDIDLNRFTLSPFAPLLKNQFHTLKGELSGQLKLSGSTDEPLLNGKLTFDSLLVNPVMLNSPLTMNNAAVSVQNNTLQFKETTLLDKNNHKAVLNGTVAYRPDNQTTFNLKFKASDFMFVNVAENEQDLYHGTLITDMDADLTGNLDHPVLKLNTIIKNGSDLHFTVPESSVNPEEDQDIAEFINRDTSMVTKVSDQSLNYSGIMPDVTANISFQDNIPLTIVIDPVSKEQLQVSGKGDFSLRLRDNLEPSLSGRYTINSGKYTLLLYSVFKRTFNIRQGSYLLWTGNVYKPTVNMVASYDVNTSPIGLVATELNAGSQSLSQYRNPIPFSVVMNLKGDLLSPDINFDIETPPGKADALVSEKLSRLNNDESAVNKQVLSLLIFKSFMNQNVGGPDVAYQLNNTARNGLSNILSNSFNQFAQNYIKGINLTLDVESRAGLNGSGSGNTDLIFGASKSLFSDRLTIEVGSSINVENENNRPPGSGGLAGDFKIDYKISKDGSVSVQAFRSSEYEDVLVGDVTKTGVALKLSKAFTHFSELFKRDNKKMVQKKSDEQE
ncbi:translocation/assembly module TamB domain-containing protein [Saccharicrinis sp. FJH2]|uniref:translocation/assembly module TamB domain-containing protein n=1 Tax=Saccharicrinis sp. FJH65 TaxID=3344659 RepID=UPI0035F4D75B